MSSRSPLRSIGRLALIVFCLGSVLVLVLFLLPIYLDITAFKGPVEEFLTDLVEAPVTVAQARLNLSLWPTLRLSRIEVQGSGWEEAPLFTQIESAEIQVSLPSLLRRKLSVKSLSASNLDFHVHRPEGESGNWPAWTSLSYEITELSDVEFDNVTIFLDDHDIGQADAMIERLELDIARNRPLELELRGTLEGLPLSLKSAGPTLTDLSPKASGFPVSVDLELSDLRLDLSGPATRTPSGTRLLLDVHVESPNLAFLRGLEMIDLPQIGGFNLDSRVSIRDSSFELFDIQGEIGPTSVHGVLSLQTGSDRPGVMGKVSLGQIDLQPWIDHLGELKTAQPQPLPFELLTAFDAGLELKIEKVSGLEVEIDRVSTSFKLHDGDLVVPLQLQLAGVPLTAEIGVRYGGELAEILAVANSQNVEFEQLRSLVDVPDHLTGAIGQMRATASTSGRFADDLIAHLVARIEVDDATLFLTDESAEGPLEVEFERAHIVHRTGQPLAISVNGRFLEEDFLLDLETASLDSLTDTDTWPIDVALRGSGATIGLHGVVVSQDEGLDADIEFLLSGDRLGELDAWLGFPPDLDIAYQLGGHVTTSGGARSIQIDESAIGRTRFWGTLSWDVDREEVPLQSDLHASALDLRELQGVFDPITDLDTEEGVIGLDLPILPSGVVFPEAAINLAVDRLYREPSDLTDIHAALDFRQGQLARSPFSFQYQATEFDGELELDLRGETPRFALDLTSSASNLRQVLDREDLISDARITADRLELSLAAEGASIRQIVESADIAGRLTDVQWQISLPGSEKTLDMRLEELTLTGPKGEPIVLESAGSLDKEPLHLRVTIRAQEKSQVEHGLSLPFHLQAELASTELALDGEFSLPITDKELDLDLLLSGKTLSDLSSLAKQDLPDLGPYRLTGRLAVTDHALFLQDFDLKLGESDLQGSLEYRQIEGRPTFTAKLLSQRTRSQDYLPSQQREDSKDEGESEKQRTLADFDTAKLSLDTLTGFDASVDLEINQLDTGGGPLEHLTFSVELDRGDLLLLMQRPQPDDKVAQIAAHVEPLDRGGIDAHLKLQWERQPYGLLADILNPGTAQGSWSLNVGLQTHGASVEELLANLGGHFDFTDYPVDFNATILDLWGGGLVTSLMPVFNLGSESRINCTVGRFVVEEGVFKAEKLIVDATRSRVRGRGYLDLPNNTIKLRLKPRPKKRNLINLAMPVKIRGSVTDPSIHFTTSGMAVTAFRLSLWVYTVWLEILRKPLPSDGSDICLDPQPR